MLPGMLDSRDTDVKDYSGEISGGNEECVLGTGRKALIVRKWQRTWLDCAFGFCGRLNL